MELHYTVTIDDYLAFNMYHALHAKSGKWPRLVLRFGLPAFCLFAYVLLGLQTGDWVVGIALLVLGILLFFFSPMLLDAVMKFSVRLALKDGKNNHFIGEQQLKLQDDVIEGKTSMSSSALSYSAVERIVLFKHYIIIYVGAVQGIIIPDSAFHSPEEKIEFLRILERKTDVGITDNRGDN